jgi:hypothetical protein
MERIAADVEAFHLGLGDLDAFLVDPCGAPTSALKPVSVSIPALAATFCIASFNAARSVSPPS